MNEYDIVSEILNRYNKGKIDLPDDQAELLAMKAARMGLDFDVKSKPFKKGAFDVADMALFGLLPNEWRPRSPGQDLYGETSADRWAGGLGTALGLGTGVYGGIRGAKAIGDLYKSSGGVKSAVAKAKEHAAAKRARDLASNVYNRGSNVVQGGVAAGGRAARRVSDYIDPMRSVDLSDLGRII